MAARELNQEAASSAKIWWTVLPRVSGTLVTRNAAKGKSTRRNGKKQRPPNVEARGRNTSPTAKLASQLQMALKDEPAATLSGGKSSAGYSQGTGPMPTPKEPTNETTARTANGAVHAWPGLVRATVSIKMAIHMPSVDPRISGLRPAMSISQADVKVISTLPRFISTATTVTVAASIPFWERNVELKLKALLMPESCCRIIIEIVMYRALRTAGLVAAALRMGSCRGVRGSESLEKP
mmetsp:Transcript_83005/g.165722  ORF Transcript_83005/g.165722 Transcript_83005/m.165722 type:complete len:238 (-) Transcript_83005:605-1318(-)